MLVYKSSTNNYSSSTLVYFELGKDNQTLQDGTSKLHFTSLTDYATLVSTFRNKRGTPSTDSHTRSIGRNSRMKWKRRSICHSKTINPFEAQL